MNLKEINEKTDWDEFCVVCITAEDDDKVCENLTELARLANECHTHLENEITIKFRICQKVRVFSTYLPSLDDVLDDVTERYLIDNTEDGYDLMQGAKGREALSKAWSDFIQANKDYWQAEDTGFLCEATVGEFRAFLRESGVA